MPPFGLQYCPPVWKYHTSVKNITRRPGTSNEAADCEAVLSSCVRAPVLRTYKDAQKHKKNKNLLFLGVELGGALAHGLDPTADTVHVFAKLLCM